MPSRRVEIPFGKREGVAHSHFVSSQSLTNAFVEIDPEVGPAIYGGFGLDEFATVGSGPIRGVFAYNATLWYVVSGTALYSVTTAGVVSSSLGTIAGTEPVIISSNGLQLAINADTLSYTYTIATATLAQITDPDFEQSSSVDFLDQYFIWTKTASSVFFPSALADGTDYDALDQQTAESKPEDNVRLIVDSNEVLIFKKTCVQGYYDTGGDPIFGKTATFSDYGLAGRNAVARQDNSTIWLANDLTVRALRGGTAVAISDPQVTDFIQSWTNPETARAFAFEMRGHAFWALRHDDGCMIWDASSPAPIQWGRRKSYGYETWNIGCAATIGQQTLFGSTLDGTLFLLNANTFAEGDDNLVREMVTRTMGPGGRPFTLDGFEVEAEVGVGLVSGQGSDPKIWAYLSRDGGETYGARMERSLGAIGVRGKRVVWNAGYGQFLPHGGVIKIGCSDPVRLVITKMWADLTEDAI